MSRLCNHNGLTFCIKPTRQTNFNRQRLYVNSCIFIYLYLTIIIYLFIKYKTCKKRHLFIRLKIIYSTIIIYLFIKYRNMKKIHLCFRLKIIVKNNKFAKLFNIFDCILCIRLIKNVSSIKFDSK